VFQVNLAIPPELEEFRLGVRAFIRSSLPRDIAQRQREGWHCSENDLRRWFRILDAKGWAVPDWPAEFGGPGWTPIQSYVFEDECAAADAPHNSWRAGSSLVGPVIYTFGSDVQKARYLPKIRSGDEFWAQGFSEPNAGSDLASLRTMAVQRGEDFIVNGQKIWTSEAHFAQLMFTLVRTDASAKPQQGISCLIIDLRSPGVTVRSIFTIDNGRHVNEIFLEDVRVPVVNLVGELNRGWTYAKFLLSNERHSNALVQRIKQEARKLRCLANDAAFGERFMDKPAFRRKIAQLEIETTALEWAVIRAASGERGPGTSRDMAFASALKIVGSELQQRVADLQLEVLGPWIAPEFLEPHDGPWVGAEHPAKAPLDAPGIVTKALFRRAATIYGGANEIQRSIIWRSIFEGKGA
jgi:alkylation response protein AidB-like acyl-CoA dehydrogenase